MRHPRSVPEMDARCPRIAQNHEFDAALVALRFAEMTFGVNFRPHFHAPIFVLLRTKHDDAARVTFGKLHDGLKLNRGIFGRRLQPKMKHEIYLRRFRVVSL